MGQASTVETLPPDILEQLQALLRDPRVSQLEATRRINAVLEEAGHPERVSKSSVNRYDLKMREVGERLRHSREVAAMWIGKLGAAPQGEVGNLINETLRTLSFDLTLMLAEGELTEEKLPGVIDMVKQLSLAVVRLENAASTNVKRQAELERQAREAALSDAAKRVDSAAQARGLNVEEARFWREQVLMGM